MRVSKLYKDRSSVPGVVWRQSIDLSARDWFLGSFGWRFPKPGVGERQWYLVRDSQSIKSLSSITCTRRLGLRAWKCAASMPPAFGALSMCSKSKPSSVQAQMTSWTSCGAVSLCSLMSMSVHPPTVGRRAGYGGSACPLALAAYTAVGAKDERGKGAKLRSHGADIH